MIFPLTVVRSAGLPFSALESPVFDLPAVESAWHRAKEHLHELGAAWPAIFKQVLAAMPDSARRTALYNFSRKVRRQVASGQFVSIAYPDRAEAPPVELVHAIAQWNAAIAAEQQGKHRFEVLYFETLTDEITRLQHLAAGETLQGALLFTSHDLLQQLPVWTQKAVSDFDKKDRRMARAVWQYAARATYKTTPRSRLATVGVVDVAKVAADEASPWMDGEEWSLSAGKKNTSKITPNAALLPLLYDALLKAPAFYHTLKITLNPCIHQSESTNYEWLYYNGAQESFQQVEAGEALNFIVNTLLSAPAPYTFAGLLALLTTATDNPQESEILLFHLADTGFLEWVWPENGLSSNWCSSLYQYLGYLPALPVIADAAQVLQWLKTAARTLPFQSVPQARTTIAEAADLLNGFLQRYGVDCPPIAPEQVFYEDVAHHQPPLPCADALQKWAEQLSLLVQDAATTPVKAVLHGHGALEHAKVAQFLRDHYPDNDPVSFSDFSKKYTGLFDYKKNFTQLKLSYQFKNPNTKANPIKTGALLQVFQENGQQKAVLNALYPGGGKLLARWLHLFDAQYSRVVAQWNAEPHLAAFPWQHWSNAAFQPDIGMQQVSAPGNRMPQSPGKPQIAWSNLFIRHHQQACALYDGQTGHPVQFADIGLDAPDSKPPVMRLLWAAGCRFPFISLPTPAETVSERVGEWLPGQKVRVEKRGRVVAGDLVLQRAVWHLHFEGQAAYSDLPEHAPLVFNSLRNCLRHCDIPRYCFVQALRSTAAKPQFIDQESPIALQILEKLSKKYANTGLLVTEMLPTPENAMGIRAEEIAIEFGGGLMLYLSSVAF